MLELFNFTDTLISGERYLYHSIVGAPSRPEHRNIIINNENKLHIVPYTHQMPDGNESVCFALGTKHHGFQPLHHTFHAKKLMTKEELILLMYGVINTITHGLKHGLFENSFVLDPKHIYLKPRSTVPYLLYIPMAIEVPLKAQFAELVIWLEKTIDNTRPDTAEMIMAFKNIARGGGTLYDIAAVVVQAANNKDIDKKYLIAPPQAKTAPPKIEADKTPTKKSGLFGRLIGSFAVKESAQEENPLDSLDEKTILNLTDMIGGENFAALYVLENGQKNQQIPITKDIFVLGRKRGDVDFVFEEMGISRKHATITFAGSGYTITDNGSSGGTYVNGVRIALNGTEAIKNGDEIQLYTKKMVFEC